MKTDLETSPRKRARQERSRATVEAILQGAARVLLRDGYDRASTNRIAEAAGVSIGSLYQYFPSKEAIVAELLDRHVARVAEVMVEPLGVLAEAPLEEAVPQLVAAFFRVQAVDPQLRRVFIEQVPRLGRLDRFNQVEAQVMALAQAALERRRDKVVATDLALTAYVLVHAVAAVTYKAAMDPPPFSEAALVAEISAVILARLTGLAAE